MTFNSHIGKTLEWQRPISVCKLQPHDLSIAFVSWYGLSTSELMLFDDKLHFFHVISNERDANAVQSARECQPHDLSTLVVGQRTVGLTREPAMQFEHSFCFIASTSE